MRFSASRTSRVGALALGAVTSLAVLSGTAAAAGMDAPYARAAAKVSSNASLLGSKNVGSVTRGTGTSQAGVYCVKVSDSNINLASAAIVATLNNSRGEITAIGQPHGYCGNATDTITIVTSDSSGNSADRPFTVAVL
ncbi:hypothetical protein OHU11_42400 (plasmid) [Streptomyces sp. NBC_00257]|uniref:hypothetical protein n=1 Tax=unclassified Streptomyces TaxID=2593676 RepID=UPI002257F388|nr:MULTISPECIES: hypothetical protein [unclassified Streptomyces]MCX5434829.1 hypothetical protein [Streptomyces sp. NBC_00062]